MGVTVAAERLPRQLEALSLPRITPMPLARVAGGTALLVSRSGKTYKSFPDLTAALGAALAVQDARDPRWRDRLPGAGWR